MNRPTLVKHNYWLFVSAVSVTVTETAETNSLVMFIKGGPVHNYLIKKLSPELKLEILRSKSLNSENILT